MDIPKELDSTKASLVIVDDAEDEGVLGIDSSGRLVVATTQETIDWLLDGETEEYWTQKISEIDLLNNIWETADTNQEGNNASEQEN